MVYSIVQTYWIDFQSPLEATANQGLAVDLCSLALQLPVFVCVCVCVFFEYTHISDDSLH